MNIICISGKARHGKDTFAGFLADALERRGQNVVIFHYADLLKFIAKQYFGWDGTKDEAGRTILQKLGTDIVRERDPNFWVDYAVRLFSVFSEEWDYVLIPDTRFPNEIKHIRHAGFNQVLHYEIFRGENFDNGLTEEQKNHPSETALDDVEADHYICNFWGLEELRMEAEHTAEDLLY